MEAYRPLSTLGRIAYFGTFLAIFVAAIPKGSIEPWHKGLFVITIAVFGMIRVADGLLNKDFRLAEPRLLLPLIGILGLAALQLVPISLDHQLSLDPYQTQSFILVFGSLIVCAELLFNYTGNNGRLRQLVGLVLTIAIGSSLYGLIWSALELVDLDVYLGSGLGEKGYAQFANRNHFALLAEMGLGLLVGVLLKGHIPRKWILLGWVGCGVLLYSIIAASSRGGLASLTGIAIFAVFVHVMTRSPAHDKSRTRKSGRSERSKLFTKFITAASLCLVTFGTIAVLVALIGGEAVVSRIEQIDLEITTEATRLNRAAIWESTFEMIKERPLVGIGFGAYGAAITKYDSSDGHFLLQEAHNDYLEIVANGGVIGALLFLLFAILVGRRMINNMLSSHGFRRACCFGSIIGVVGVLIHSFVDFGLHVLVNALVFTALIVIGTSSVESSVERSVSGRSVGT